jgi:hypothetical protein
MPRAPDPSERPIPARAPEIEFCVHGEPVSAWAHNRARLAAWQRRVRQAARVAWPERRNPIEVAVELRITHYGERRVIDMDNLIKPVQDALQGIAYVDDRQVKDVTGNFRDIDGRYSLRYISPCLSAAFSHGREFVHVRVWLARDDEELG